MAKNGSSVTNVRAISFAENRTFRAFIGLYTVMSLLILLLIGMLYYRYQREVMLSEQRLSMQLEGEVYLPRLVAWMQGDLADFPVDPAYETAFFVRNRLIGGHLFRMPGDLSPGIHKEEDAVYLVIPMGSYGLKDGRAVMMTRDDTLWYRRFWRHALLGGGAMFALLLLIGFGLSKLFLRPMRDAVALLDDFIKDTTHELNTPVTAILTNIERIDTGTLDEKQRRKLLRVETAARTIGTIYDDLTWLLLRRDRVQKREPVDIGALLEERLEYFRTRCEMKGLTVRMRQRGVLRFGIDRQAAVRLLDNLLSNAVKYSDPGGMIRIETGPQMLRIANGGVGIPEEKLSRIFDRYVRADESRGGFGIGLHIVARIAKEYAIGIRVSSREGETVFELRFG